jgi:hypothetical protein
MEKVASGHSPGFASIVLTACVCGGGKREGDEQECRSQAHGSGHPRGCGALHGRFLNCPASGSGGRTDEGRGWNCATKLRSTRIFARVTPPMSPIALQQVSLPVFLGLFPIPPLFESSATYKAMNRVVAAAAAAVALSAAGVSAGECSAQCSPGRILSITAGPRAWHPLYSRLSVAVFQCSMHDHYVLTAFVFLLPSFAFCAACTRCL